MAQFSSYPKIPGSASLGQQTMAASAPVVIASNQSPIPVTGTFWQSTQPVSVASLPLPSGAATSAKQDTGNTSLSSIDSKMTACNTGSVTIASSALPSGAATSAKQDTGNTSLASIDTKTPSLGQALAAASVPVVLTASQLATLTPLATVAVTGTFWQATQPVSGTVAATQSGTWNSRTQDGSGNSLTSATQGSNRGLHEYTLGFSSANAPIRNDYTSTSVTTSAYTQLVASLTSDCQEIEIFDSSGQTLKLATGAAASEVDQMIIFPGGNGRVKLRIASGTRVSVKALSATASVGELDINFYG